MRIIRLIAAILLLSFVSISAQETVIVRPVETDDILVNPGMGFMTFMRFNGDTLNINRRWSEGHPIDYQRFEGSLENPNYPATSIAYFRIYWKYLELENGKYRWELIDRALKTAHDRKQTLMLRLMPYGRTLRDDVPKWYRTMVGPRKDLPVEKWMCDPEDPRYAEYFGRLVRA